MALSNLEGSTIGGLAKAEGTTLVFWHSQITLTDVSTGAAIFGVDKDGTVANSNANIALAVTYGHGLTLKCLNSTRPTPVRLSNCFRRFWHRRSH